MNQFILRDHVVTRFWHRHKFDRYLRFLIAFAAVSILLFPIFWMVKISITPKAEIFVLPPNWFTFTPSFDGYLGLAENTGFFTFFFNSVIIGFGTMAVCLIAGILAAYSFSRFEYRGKNILMMITLSAQMFPWALLLISIYILFSRLGLLDNRLGVMLAHSTFALPMTTWMIKGYFDTIPIDLEESAYIDGCSRMRTLWNIILPITTPGIAAAAIYVFIFSWNDYIFGLTLTLSDRVRTLAPGIALSFIGENEYHWNQMMAAAITVSFPVILAFLFLQKAFVRGLTAGAVKE